MMMNTDRRVTPAQAMATQGRRWAQALVLSVALGAAGAAMALPTPQDIQTSVQSGRLDKAESQLREVLQAKPNSAKAHYELGEVLAREGRYIEAQQSLREAQRLEPSLKFASSPQKFQDLLDKVNAKAAPAPSTSAARAAVPAAVQPMAAAREPSGLPWGIIALAVAGLVLLVVWMRRSAAANVLVAQPAPAPMGGAGYGAAYNPAPGYGAVPPAGGGSTVAGAVVGGLAGVAAGYALSKALEGHSGAAPGVAGTSGNAGGYVPFDAPAAAPDFGDFDAGAGQGWDNADGGDIGGGGGGSDDW